MWQMSFFSEQYYFAVSVAEAVCIFIFLYFSGKKSVFA